MLDMNDGVHKSKAYDVMVIFQGNNNEIATLLLYSWKILVCEQITKFQ